MGQSGFIGSNVLPACRDGHHQLTSVYIHCDFILLLSADWGTSLVLTTPRLETCAWWPNRHVGDREFGSWSNQTNGL